MLLLFAPTNRKIAVLRVSKIQSVQEREVLWSFSITDSSSDNLDSPIELLNPSFARTHPLNHQTSIYLFVRETNRRNSSKIQLPRKISLSRFRDEMFPNESNGIPRWQYCFAQRSVLRFFSPRIVFELRKIWLEWDLFEGLGDTEILANKLGTWEIHNFIR